MKTEILQIADKLRVGTIDYKEAKIKAFTGIYGCLIMANTSTGKYIPWFWIGLAILWTVKYIYLTAKD